MSKSHEYEVMISVLPEAGYPIEPFEWSLHTVQIWCVCLLQDWRLTNFKTGHFNDSGQFKVYSHFADFGQIKIDPFNLFLLALGRSQSFTEFGQDARLQKTNPLCLTKTSRTTHRIWHKSFSMIQWAGIKNWLSFPVKK